MISFGDIFKGLAKEGVGAVGRAGKELLGTGGSTGIGMNTDSKSFDAAAPKVPERSPIADSRPDRDAEKSVKEPILDTATFKFTKIKGTNIIRALDQIHSGIIGYLNTVNSNTTKTFNYVRDVTKRQDARLNVLSTDVKTLRKSYDLLDRRLLRVERKVDALSIRKPGTPWPEQSGVKHDSMSIGGGGMGLKDIVSPQTAFLGGTAAGAAGLGLLGKLGVGGAMGIAGAAALKYGSEAAADLSNKYLPKTGPGGVLNSYYQGMVNPNFPPGIRYTWLGGVAGAGQHIWNNVPGSMSLTPPSPSQLGTGFLRTNPLTSPLYWGAKGIGALMGSAKAEDGTMAGNKPDARAVMETLDIKRADINLESTSDIKLTATRDILMKGRKISLSGDIIELDARTITIKGEVNGGQQGQPGQQQTSTHSKDADRGGGSTFIDRWGDLPSEPTPTIPRGGGGSDSPGQSQFSGRTIVMGTGLGNAIDTARNYTPEQGQRGRQNFEKYARGMGFGNIKYAEGDSLQAKIASAIKSFNENPDATTLAGFSQTGYTKFFKEVIKGLNPEALGRLKNVMSFGAGGNFNPDEVKGPWNVTVDPQHNNVFQKLAQNVSQQAPQQFAQVAQTGLKTFEQFQQRAESMVSNIGRQVQQFTGANSKPTKPGEPYVSSVFGSNVSAAKEYLKTMAVGGAAGKGGSGEIMRKYGFDPIGHMNDEVALKLATAMHKYNAERGDLPSAKLTSGARFPLPGMPGGFADKSQSIHAAAMAGDISFTGKLDNYGPHVEKFSKYGKAEGLHWGREVYGGGESHHWNLIPNRKNPFSKSAYTSTGTPIDINQILAYRYQGIGDGGQASTQAERVQQTYANQPNVGMPVPGTMGQPFINVGNRANAPQAPGQPSAPTGNLPGQSGVLAGQRSSIAGQIAKNPSLQDDIMAIMASEQDSPQGRMAVYETMLNRANTRGINDANRILGARDRSNKEFYYAPFEDGAYQRNLQRIKNDPKFRAQLQKEMEEVHGGSDYSNLGTHNASLGVAARARQTQTITKEIGEEIYSRKDRPEYAKTHGPGTVKREAEWHQRTSEAMRLEREAMSRPPGQQAPTQRELVGYKYTAKGEYANYMTGTPVPFGMYNFAEQRLLNSMRHIKPDDDKTKPILKRAEESQAMAGFRQSGAMNIQTLMDEIKPTDKEWAQFQKGGMGEYLSREGVYRDVPVAAQQQSKLRQWQPDVPYNYQGDYKNVYGNTDFQGGLVPNVPSAAANAPIQSQTSRQYGERTLNLQHGESQEYIRAQMKRSKAAGWGSWEADNMDTKSDAEMEQVFRIAKEEGVGVILKNPTSDQMKKFGPRSAGAVYEADSGKSPSQVEADRKAAKVDNLPVSFVGYGDGQRNTMNNVATQIATNKFANMSAQWGEGSKGREYRNTQVLPGGMGYGPATGLQQVTPTPTQTQLQKVEGAPFSTPESRASWSQMPGAVPGPLPAMATMPPAEMGSTTPIGGKSFAEASGLAGVPGFDRKGPGSALLDIGRMIPFVGAAQDIYKGVSGLLSPKSPIVPSTDANVSALRAGSMEQVMASNIAAQAQAETPAKELPVEDWTKGLGELDGPPTDATPVTDQSAKQMTAEAPTDAIQKEASGAVSAVPQEPSPSPGTAQPVSAGDATLKEPAPPSKEEFSAETVNPDSFTGWPKDGGGTGPTEKDESKPIGGRRPSDEGTDRSGPRREGGPLRPPVHNPESEMPKPGDNGYGTGRRDPDGLGLCTI